MPRQKLPHTQPRPGGKIAVSFRVSPETIRALRDLARTLPATQAEVVEQAVKEFAGRREHESLSARLDRLETDVAEIRRMLEGDRP